MLFLSNSLSMTSMTRLPIGSKVKLLSSYPALSICGGAIETVAQAATQAVDFDINRAKIRLEGLSSYAMISVLLMNSALRLYTSVPKKINTDKESKDYVYIENVATIVFSLSSILSIVTGTNTAIIFSLMNLYSKTALGMSNDAAFIEFFASTASMRSFGFQSMILSLISLQLSFILSVFLYFKGNTRYFLSGLSGAASIASLMVWTSVIEKASILFR